MLRELDADIPTAASSDSQVSGGVLIVVENLPVPFDRRVWQEATALREAGYTVSVICPKGKGHEKAYEEIAGIHIYRHPLPLEASGVLGYALEYGAALFWQFLLSLRIRRRHGFDVIHACNPPDLIFIVGWFHKIAFGTKFLFDQHDINPELFEVKFGKKGLLYRVLVQLERWTFQCADGSLATNETLKELAVSRGRMAPDRVWVVRSVPDLERWRPAKADVSARRNFRFLIGYMGIMAEQDGVHLLIEAMNHVVNRMGRPDVGCLIIGGGPELPRLIELTDIYGLRDHVLFQGYLTGNALISKLSACDIGVIPDPPNVCNQRLSMNKVFEYMAVGLPFVQFDLKQAKSDAGDAAYVAREPTGEALAEGMIDLLGSEEARQRMSDYGRARAHREFRWDVEKQSLLSAYRAVLAPYASATAKARS